MAFRALLAALPRVARPALCNTARPNVTLPIAFARASLLSPAKANLVLSAALLKHSACAPVRALSLWNAAALHTPLTRTAVCRATPASVTLTLPTRTLKTRARQIKRGYRKKTTYKLKTKKAIAARFKPVGNGNLKYWRRGRVHNSGAKTQKQHRQLRRPKYLSGKMLIKYRRALQG